MACMSIDSNGRSHAPAGIPTGGRFQPGSKREADTSVSLSALRKRAADEHDAAARRMHLTTAKLVAEETLELFPTSRHIELKDVEGCGYYTAGRILDSAGDPVGTGRDVDGLDDYLSDLPLSRPYKVVTSSDGVRNVEDPRYEWLTVTNHVGTMRALLDVPKAAAIDIDAGFHVSSEGLGK